MARKRPKRLTPVEAVIMDSLWTLRQATVREVREQLAPRKRLAYNTVLTMMRILREKGFLASERRGRTDVYRSLVSREEMGRTSLGEVLDRFFAGSPRALVSELLESDGLSADEIKAIRREVNEKLREKGERK